MARETTETTHRLKDWTVHSWKINKSMKKNQKNQFKWLESSENNNTIYHVLGETTKAILREKNPALWLRYRVTANKEPNVAPQSLKKQEEAKPHSSRW